MALLLFVVFIIVPLAELYVIVQVAGSIGALETIALLIAVAILGSWLMKRQGAAAWSRFRLSLERGRVPTDEISDGALIMFGGALLLTPGFLTDILALVLLVPPSRAAVKAASRRRIKRWAEKRAGIRGTTEARVVRVERDPTRRSSPDPAPSDEHPAALEDDSRDRG